MSFAPYSDVRCTLFALIFICQRLPTLQRGLSAIDDLHVLVFAAMREMFCQVSDKIRLKVEILFRARRAVVKVQNCSWENCTFEFVPRHWSCTFS